VDFLLLYQEMGSEGCFGGVCRACSYGHLERDDFFQQETCAVSFCALFEFGNT